ncbi:DUF4388 domain-containing protein [Deinococcus yunweiensis]|uniref:DUF4388 domain-containing protein n=1 Tax=Deinococcus yunweiensis TaxID=367282 RepID=UPI00398E7B9D
MLFISDTLPPLGEYLTIRSPLLQQCVISDASHADDAIRIMGDTPPNLVVIQVSTGRYDAAALLDHARLSWPQTAFLAFTAGPDETATSLVDTYGDMTCLNTPDVAALCAAIELQIQRLCFGLIRGVSMPNLLQMLHWERRSVSLLVRRGEGSAWGRLHLRAGNIVDAYVHETGRSGEDAALEVLSWEHAVTTLERSYRNQHTAIHTSLQGLLMEAMKRQDESSRAPPTGTDAGLTGFPDENVLLVSHTQTPIPASTSSSRQLEPPAASGTGLRATPLHDISAMSNINATLETALNTIDGALAAALVDHSSGMPLGKMGSGVNLDMAAAGNTEVVRAKLRTMEMFGIKGGIEDILITLDTQYHILYLIPKQPLFLYLVLNRDRANLAMARFKLMALGSELPI